MLPSTVSVNDLTPEVDNIACLTNLDRFEEGERVFLEEDEGEMAFDPDLQRNLIGYVSFVDPRTRFLGSRIIAVSDCIEADDMKDMNFYRMWRIINGVAEGTGVENNELSHLNFQYFNGQKGFESEVETYCAMVITGMKKSQIEIAVDYDYNKKLNSLRVIDSNGKFFGVVYENYHNLLLIKLVEKPTDKLLLENGDKVNIWRPKYMIKID